MPLILAVDDSPSMRKMVSFTLTGAGYQVVEAVDGVDAYEKAQGGNPARIHPGSAGRPWRRLGGGPLA